METLTNIFSILGLTLLNSQSSFVFNLAFLYALILCFVLSKTKSMEAALTDDSLGHAGW